MDIINKKVVDLSPKEYRTCKRLSFREDGLMYYDITTYRAVERVRKGNYRRSQVFMIYEKDVLVSWALLTPRPKRGWTAQFYTRKSYRNLGYGSKLMELVKTVDPKPYVIPHDARSGGFFKKQGKFIKYSPFDSKWVNT